jgi:hypothetical protein
MKPTRRFKKIGKKRRMAIPTYAEFKLRGMK